jgi:hypothetical protein
VLPAEQAVIRFTTGGGSILDADYPHQGVKIARRFTSLNDDTPKFLAFEGLLHIVDMRG